MKSREKIELQRYGPFKKKFKLFRKRLMHRLKIYSGYHRDHAKKEQVFILTTRRSGSNLLLSYLNSIPGVSFASEVLNPHMYYGIREKNISKRAVMRHLRYSMGRYRARVCGAKLLFVHMKTHGLTVEDLLTAFPGARFIVLYRKSLIDQFLSFKIATVTDQWEWTDSFRLPDAVRLNPFELIRYSHEIKGFYQQILAGDKIESRSILISYEDLARDAQRVFDEAVFPFLGLGRCEVFTQMQKQNTKTLREIVANYGEIEPWIHSDRFRQDYSFGGIENPQIFFSYSPTIRSVLK